jgi:hypothetical protein
MAQWKFRVPGRMMIKTPMKPMMTASQRRGPTRSPSSSGDSAHTHSGLENMMDEVWASWRWLTATKLAPVETTSNSPRTTWSPPLPVASSAAPPCCHSQMATKTSEKA